VGFADGDYRAAGAQVLDSAEKVWDAADMIIKVKEPLEQEYGLMKEGQVLYTYLHLAADKPLTLAMMERKVKGVAYETLTNDRNELPLLRPMSEIAGRLSSIEGAKCLQKSMGGAGVLLSGVPGAPKAKVVILGGGVVGTNACKMALGMQADVTIFDVNLDRLTYLDDIFGGHVKTLFSSEAVIEKEVEDADLVIGAVLIPGASAPKIVKRKYFAKMKPGSVVVDVAVDQGGCTETTRPTTHEAPTFVTDGVVQYCVANMPGSVARTSTMALTNATLPYGLKIAGGGLEKVASENKGIADAVNTYGGECTHKNVAESLGLAHTPLSAII
jgi:alanine dehydrogenase